LPQFGQRPLDVTPLALQHIDLLDAFSTADWQSLVAAASARGEHFADFSQRKTQSLALQDQREAIAVVMGEKASCRGVSKPLLW
jgi:hypothetical protein